MGKNIEKYPAVELKWNPRKKVKIPRAFLGKYPNSKILTVNPKNFEKFLLSIEPSDFYIGLKF